MIPELSARQVPPDALFVGSDETAARRSSNVWVFYIKINLFSIQKALQELFSKRLGCFIYILKYLLMAMRLLTVPRAMPVKS